MVLQTIWFFLWGLLWALFFMTDGFDLGIGTLYPFLGKTDQDKRIMINALGPLWDGNEVWLITAGGVTFAAFPLVYSVMFSSLYSALMLILFALILRGVSFEFRGKVDHPRWRKIWDTCIFFGSFVPALLFGVAFANIFQGIPIDHNGIYHGTLFTLLNPYGLLGGILFVLLFMIHGALWISIKSEGDLQERAISTAKKLWPVLLGVVVIFLIASKFSTRLFDNYIEHPAFFIVILITVLAFLSVRFFLVRKTFFKAWFASALTIVGTTFFGVIGLFPNLFPSSLNPRYSLTAYNASSSPLTLKIMLVVVTIFIPLIIGYQIWAYNLFKGKVTQADLAHDEAY
ncbi:MAG: cytochrome d ubiquinol oxidase subunit II [Desulfobacteraceae bacterium]|nr:cytochrome d ubiquinol oxidase subunit II [Desulfobacteraceae bacterium]MDH3573361.1 cytochrome d ubiquinol oxidase subunit II [Desulfobacteraceae bacterium]MDH3719930.1 cytochrome d ubiquinol oxidase subunit II [Desulfobacteraceae bacterium]MDH3835566.1 cytochrome d ubiquinol oxidase subunit II [Desulfobacteraceae bacterium]MDH3872754.1 cytochrome d ubiquinol oxidase subunit II [Desulfobacteraceae bacterium]